MGSHSMNDVEAAALDLLRVHLGADDIAGPLQFCVSLVWMTEDVHDMVASVLSQHPGRRRVILCLHSGERDPVRLEMVQKASVSCVGAMTQVLGRYAT